MLPGVHLPLRCTLVKLPSGALWMHSPVALRPAVAEEIRQLGEVVSIVAPNGFHHLFVKQAREHSPVQRSTFPKR